MIGTESLFPFRQRTLVERLRVDVTTLGVVKQCQTVQCRGNIGVNGTVGFFSYRQGALEQRYGSGVTTLGAAKLRQIGSATLQHPDDRDRIFFLVCQATACR